MSVEGWVKLHRKIIDSRVFSNEGLLKVWLYCLCRANHKKTYVPIRTGRGDTEVELIPGQFIFGRKSASNDLKMNPSTVYKRLKKLEKMKNLNTKSNNHYTIVTICNWETYQSDENDKEQEKEQRSNNEVAGKYPRSNTDKNDKNVKNDKKRSRVIKILNDLNIPSFAKPLFKVKGFRETFVDYWMMRKEKYNHWPTESETKECYRKLLDLAEGGNNPVSVIRQTIAAGNKSFYPVRNYDNDLVNGQPLIPIYLSRRL